MNSSKKKILIFVVAIEVIVIAASAAFFIYMNSDTAKVARQLKLAQKYLLEEDYEQAIAAFELAIEIDPKNEEAYIGLAEAYMQSDDMEKAVKTLEKASKKTDSKKVEKLLAKYTEEFEQATVQDGNTPTPAENAPAASESGANTNETEAAALITGFVTQNGEIYYYDGQGNLVTGWFDAEGNRYYAQNDGRLYKGGKYKIDGKEYDFDANAVCLGEVKQAPKGYTGTYRIAGWGWTDFTISDDAILTFSSDDGARFGREGAEPAFTCSYPVASNCKWEYYRGGENVPFTTSDWVDMYAQIQMGEISQHNGVFEMYGTEDEQWTRLRDNPNIYTIEVIDGKIVSVRCYYYH